MSEPAIVFDQVWKKFRRGERHDSLARRHHARRSSGRSPDAPADALDAQEFWALRDVSFEVKPGEAIGIIGANGAGKSTALKLLTKILRPTSGACRVRGRVGALIEIARGFSSRSDRAREPLPARRDPRHERAPRSPRRLDAIVDFAGIRDFIDTPVKRYSSGMNARLGFAIAAHVDPDVLLIDEVLAVGDYHVPAEVLSAAAAVPRVGRGDRVCVAQHAGDRQLVRSRGVAQGEPVAHPRIGGGGRGACTRRPTARPNDPRITVHNFSVHRIGDAAPLRAAVAPGTPLAVEIEIEANTRLPRCGLGLEVTRTDGLTMFNGGPMIEGRAPVDLEPGARLKVRIQFRANVLRGTYRIQLNIDDAMKIWPMISVSGLASFVVHETTRVAGCAELEAVYEVSVEAPRVALADDPATVPV